MSEPQGAGASVPSPDPAEGGREGQQCGRCRRWFPADPSASGGAAGDWWACPPCHDALFGVATKARA